MRPGLKFFFFDVSVAICFVAAILSASRDVELLSKIRNVGPSCARGAKASNASTPEVTPLLEASVASGEARGTDAFPVGSVVEARGYPAVVTGVEVDGAGNITYLLTDIVHDVAMPGLDGRFVRPYRVYERGAEVHCNFEPRPAVKEVPCTVVSHMGSGRDVSYEVVAHVTETEERTVVLPIDRVFAKTRPSVAGDSQDSGAFPVGSFVEVHDSGFPALITGVKEDDAGRGNVTYFLTNAIWDFPMPGLDGRFVRPYRAYESGTAAYCNVEQRPRVSMVPCTVVSHMGSGRFMTYKVVAQLKKGDERTIMVSMTRVQRRSLKKTHQEDRE